MFITFEGTEGSGKTTQVSKVAAALREQNYEVVLTREPGGTDIGDQIRHILLNNMNNTNMQPRAELLLFCASRAQLVGEWIRPHLDKDFIVLCDRYTDSTLAYQGYGHELGADTIQPILDYATGGLYPDLTVYLDITPEKGLARRRRGMLLTNEDWNRLDAMEIAFHKRVYDGYQAIIAQDPQRFRVVDADQAQDAVTQAIMAVLRDALPVTS